MQESSGGLSEQDRTPLPTGNLRRRGKTARASGLFPVLPADSVPEPAGVLGGPGEGRGTSVTRARGSLSLGLEEMSPVPGTMESRYTLEAGFRLQGPRAGFMPWGTRVCQPPSWFQAGVCVRRGAGPPTYPEHERYENMYLSAWGKGMSPGHEVTCRYPSWLQAGSPELASGRGLREERRRTPHLPMGMSGTRTRTTQPGARGGHTGTRRCANTRAGFIIFDGRPGPPSWFQAGVCVR